MFVDRVKIFIKSGDGGNGAVSFRREKYVPNGGPDGGDGGRGGNIVVRVDSGINTLSDFRNNKHYKAGSGESGAKNRRHGKDGQDLLIKVPPGTIIREAETMKIMADLTKENEELILLKGGNGGKGNQHYATPTMQIPQYAQPGQQGKEYWVVLELKVIADIGLVGFPNVGKSTFLSRVSNAKPKIANYHFTTLHPHLGVVDLSDGKGFIIADIPGLIEGAHTGIGLGHEFLKHVERTKVLLHIVDAAALEGRNPVDDIEKINHELASFNQELAKRNQVIAANKVDILGEDEGIIHELKSKYEPLGIPVYPISAVTGEGIKPLLFHLSKLVDEFEEEVTVFQREFYDEADSELPEEPIQVHKLDEHIYSVEGPAVERMLGYTNLESEKGFTFFQKFLRDRGIIDELEKLEIEEGDTVRLYDLEFEYFR